MKVIGIIVIAIVILAGHHGPASAGDKIVLEVYTGGKTDDSRQIAPLLEALAKRGFDGGDTLRRRFEAAVSRQLGNQLSPTFAKDIDRGVDAWAAGDFAEAIKILTKTIEDAHASGGGFAKNQPLRQKLETGLIALGLATHRNGDVNAATRWFTEYACSFPGDAPSKATFGKDAVKLFQQLTQPVTSAPRGKLTVRADKNAAIYIDEKIESTTAVTRELPPGDYRVFTVYDNRLSRLHTVRVHSGEESKVEIDTAFDAVAQTSPTWTGLAYATQGERDRWEVPHAAKFGNAIDAQAIAVAGITEAPNGKTVIVGALVSRETGDYLRHVQVPLAGISRDQLEALAQYIVGETPNPPPGAELVKRSAPRPLDPPARPGDPEPEHPVTPAATTWGGWKFVAGGLAVAALGTGGALLALDGSCQDDVVPGMTCSNVYNTATPGYLAIGGGVVALGVTVYLFVRKDPASATSNNAFVVPTRGGAFAGLSTRF